MTPIGAASAAAPPAYASLRVPADAKPWETICVNGKDMITREDNLAALGAMAERFLDQTLPLYRSLAIV